jgi:hypothetical protein
MKTFTLILTAAFFAASFSVHAGNMNAVTQVATKNDGSGQMNAISNIMKPQASSRTLKPAK